MKKITLPGRPKVYFPLIALFIVLVLVFPRSPRFKYNYKKGGVWKYETLTSQFAFPILKTSEQMQEELSRPGSGVIPYYRYSDDASSKVLQGVAKLQMGDANYLKNNLMSVLSGIISKGVIADDEIRKSETDILFVQRGKRAEKFPVSEVYSLSDARKALLSELSRSAPGLNVDSLLSARGVYDCIVPNLEFDRQTTSLVSESARKVSPTMGVVAAGSVIVSNGELITAEIAQTLDSYKVEYEQATAYKGAHLGYWIGNILLAAGFVLLIYLMISNTNPLIFDDFNRYCYLLLVFLISTVSAIVVGKVNPETLYMVPFTLTALYLQAFFKNKVILPFIVISLIPLLVFCQGGIVLFVLFTVAGIVDMAVFKYFNKGWKQFISAGIVFVVLFLLFCGFYFIDQADGFFGRRVLYLFIGSMLSVAGYPLIYLFERVFNLVSSSRLTELCDTNSKLLRELEHTAPGTFQHSLQVMTMADAAARSIGANALLVKAGALYHDIGKMKNPLCFVENESLLRKDGEGRYHASLSPKESAADIIRHVSDGLEIADRYRLPDVLKDFIRTHHGTTMTAYFYGKFVSEGGDPTDTEPFTYPGGRPSTKEQIILMLCDTIEAASRTLSDHTPEAFEEFVTSVVDAKMDDGQFEDSDISIKELKTIKEVIVNYLGQLYHERIVYPSR
ncbi:MAG: HDIG domain-containing protein [Bacteroidales bacterium]|nr:HDIG domain-containing protein [Bacteroidales bacterium]